ncbi:MAG: class I SAM-dependent methyltransferase [Intrasporangium sp.]|uniref:class I SAM-dependent methyltransferase n=1 Tax=Intrasporangium sp. TaxID=1925024 RepID=UPI002648E8B5|nr:methyltransferase domain-containing protein [Intrasporangium sp.]MDN5797483.1 class I SAM-dependent methyltransferase [Intrasporangium sp.]
MSTPTTTRYLLGHDETELRRLQDQARILAPATGAFLTLAGIEPGMRVLDLGTGAGDVAFLVAGRVGPGGSVVGVDRSAAALETARRRADIDKIGNVSFLQADVATLDPGTDLGGRFDAVVGRLVLLYLDDPAEVVRRYAGVLRPGGTLLAMEYDMTAAGSLPALALPSRAMGWILAAFERAGHDPALGPRLGGILTAAGLAEPVCVGLQAYHEPGNPAGPRLLAETVRTLLPAIEGAGIATTADMDIDTLEQRIARAQQAAGALFKPPTLVGAWGHAAGPRR